MVGTFTTGYGIFLPLMADMTEMQWASAFSGAMAQTVASFKTNGQQMADAIKNIGVVAAERLLLSSGSGGQRAEPGQAHCAPAI